MSASKEIKKAGIKSLSHACRVSEVNRGTVCGWYINKPKLFKVFVAGVAALEASETKKVYYFNGLNGGPLNPEALIEFLTRARNADLKPLLE